jgi:iron complex transport system ATP-binding protein
MSSIELRGLTVRYDDRVALDSVDLGIATGEWLSLIGPNGAGKSSLLQALVGITPSTGSILVDGSPISAWSRGERARRIAYVPQDPLMPVDMTGFDYVLLGRAPYVTYLGSETRHDRSVVGAALERLDLVEFAGRKLGQLSGGERQRLVIARALATEASILVLDEPTSALDIGHQQQALDLVAGLRDEHGLTVVAAMHDLTLAGLYGDRLVLLDRGAVAATGNPADVLRADLLATHYGVQVTIHQEPDGTIAVIPRRS